METLVVTNHEVIQEFVRFVLGAENVSFRTSIGVEDVQGKLVLSDHKIPKDCLESAQYMYKIETKKRVNLAKCSLIDFMVSAPAIKPVIPEGRRSDPYYIKKAKDKALTRQEVRSIFKEKTNSLDITGTDLIKEAQKAKQRVRKQDNQ